MTPISYISNLIKLNVHSFLLIGNIHFQILFIEPYAESVLSPILIYLEFELMDFH